LRTNHFLDLNNDFNNNITFCPTDKNSPQRSPTPGTNAIGAFVSGYAVLKFQTAIGQGWRIPDSLLTNL
jgi:hypothetical protein